MCIIKSVEYYLENYTLPPYEFFAKPPVPWHSHARLDFLKVGQSITESDKQKIDEWLSESLDNEEAYVRTIGSELTKDWPQRKISVKLAELLHERDAAQEKLNDVVERFESALAEAEAICDQHKLDFSIYPAYGMGGSYSGKSHEWYSSSASC